MKTTSVIFLSFLLAFAVALQDGDKIAFKTHGTPYNARYQFMTTGAKDGTLRLTRNIDYSQESGTWWEANKLSDGNWGFKALGNVTGNVWLNGNTRTGAVNLQANTVDTLNSGTHWSLETLSNGNVVVKTLNTFKNSKFTNLNADTTHGVVNLMSSTAKGVEWEIVGIDPLTKPSSSSQSTTTTTQEIPAQNNQLADFIKGHADEIASEPTIDVNYCLDQFTSTTFSDTFGDLAGAIIEIGCSKGLPVCDLANLYGLINQLADNGVDLVTIQQIYILIGSMIGGMTGESACEGFSPCEILGGQIGTVMACLSVSKEVFDGIIAAVGTLEDYAIEAGEIGQDALNAMNYAANTLANGVQNAIDQLSKDASNGAMTALQDVSDQVNQGFNDLNNAIQKLLDDIGRTIENGVNEAGQVIVDSANEAGTWITETAQEAGQAIARVANDIASGFCGIFGC